MTGCLLVATGLGLRIWALYELRKVGIGDMASLSVATIPVAYTHAGPYRLLRHPAYVGSFIMLAGLGMIGFGTFSGGAVVVGCLPHYSLRMAQEGSLREMVEKEKG